MKYKVGQRVVLKRHCFDLEENLELNAKGVVVVVMNISEFNYQVKWDQFKSVPKWWVKADSIAPETIVLENK